MARQQNGTVSTQYREILRWGNTMKLMQTIDGIVLISVIFLSVTAIAALANDDTNTDTTTYDTTMYPGFPPLITR
jgi:hypothetical protein